MNPTIVFRWMKRILPKHPHSIIIPFRNIIFLKIRSLWFIVYKLKTIIRDKKFNESLHVLIIDSIVVINIRIEVVFSIVFLIVSSIKIIFSLKMNKDLNISHQIIFDSNLISVFQWRSWISKRNRFSHLKN